MAKDYTCPACGRATYSEKWKQCSAAGCRLNPRTIKGLDVTPNVTRKPASVTYSVTVVPDVTVYVTEIEALRAEVARLKKKVADQAMQLEQQGQVKLAALTPAQRVAAHRRRKAGAA